MIALNLGSGTPEEAAGWVKYVNARWGDKKGGLLWELGNELWGNGWQIGYPTQERIAARTRAFSEAVRKVDPKARLIATGGDPDWFEGWNAQLYTLPPGSFDFVATHFVDQTAQTVRRDPSPEFIASSAFALPVGLARRLRLLQDQINGTLHAGKAHAAFTEWLYPAPSDRGPDWTNMGGAIIVGGMLNMFMRDSDIVPVSTMTGIGHFHGQLKERGRVIGTPSYWAFRMITSADPAQLVESKTDVPAYDVHEGNNRLPEIPNVPYLDVTAALNAAGDRLSLFCVNRHLTSAVRATLQTGGFAGAGTAQTLHAGSIYERNSAESPENVHPILLALKRTGSGITCTFPPASVTVITLPRG
jgi:alpha-N-arabinofuranosidase